MSNGFVVFIRKLQSTTWDITVVSSRVAAVRIMEMSDQRPSQDSKDAIRLFLEGFDPVSATGQRVLCVDDGHGTFCLVYPCSVED
jgi:hypothetical protein